MRRGCRNNRTGLDGVRGGHAGFADSLAQGKGAVHADPGVRRRRDYGAGHDSFPGLELGHEHGAGRDLADGLFLHHPRGRGALRGSRRPASDLRGHDAHQGSGLESGDQALGHTRHGWRGHRHGRRRTGSLAVGGVVVGSLLPVCCDHSAHRCRNRARGVSPHGRSFRACHADGHGGGVQRRHRHRHLHARALVDRAVESLRPLGPLPLRFHHLGRRRRRLPDRLCGQKSQRFDRGQDGGGDSHRLGGLRVLCVRERAGRLWIDCRRGGGVVLWQRDHEGDHGTGHARRRRFLLADSGVHRELRSVPPDRVRDQPRHPLPILLPDHNGIPGGNAGQSRLGLSDTRHLQSGSAKGSPSPGAT